MGLPHISSKKCASDWNLLFQFNEKMTILCSHRLNALVKPLSDILSNIIYINFCNHYQPINIVSFLLANFKVAFKYC